MWAFGSAQRRSAWARCHVLLLAVAALLGAPPAVEAKGPPTDGQATVDLVGRPAACPAPPQVSAVLRRIAPGLRVELERAPPGAVPVGVFDEGPSFRVLVGSRSAEFKNPGRQCDERARTVAVFVSMVLLPAPSDGTPDDWRELEKLLAEGAAPAQTGNPDAVASTHTLPMQPGPPPPKAVAEAARKAAEPSPPPTPSRRLPTIDVELAALYEPALMPAVSHAGGGRVAVALGWERLGVSAGASFLSPVVLEAGGVGVPLTPVGLDVAGRFRSGRAPWGLVAEVGPSLMVDVVASPRGGTSVRAEPVARVAVGGRYAVGGQVDLSLGLEGRVSLRPVEVQDPDGVPFATTPRLWAGLLVGVSLHADRRAAP